jgi:hypothetical protein
MSEEEKEIDIENNFKYPGASSLFKHLDSILILIIIIIFILIIKFFTIRKHTNCFSRWKKIIWNTQII